MLLADTGIRRVEPASIKVSDTDLEIRTVRIEGKGAKQRRVRFELVTANAVTDAVSHLNEGDRLAWSRPFRCVLTACPSRIPHRDQVQRPFIPPDVCV